MKLLQFTRNLPIEERFWLKVQKTSSCWNWTAAISNGYGRFRHNGRSYLAHRLAYEWLVGSIPEGMTLDHTCNNPTCVNPEHLEPVSLKENIQRAALRRTQCRKGHPWVESNLRWAPAHNAYLCRTCEKERESRRPRNQKMAS